MATISNVIRVAADPAAAWNAVRDVAAVHERLAAGFAAATEMDGNTRIVTFANGAVQREPIVTVDDDTRRLVYSAEDSVLGATHYNASVQVLDDLDGNGAALEWIVDFLPDDLTPRMEEAMSAGAAAIEQTLSASPAAEG